MLLPLPDVALIVALTAAVALAATGARAARPPARPRLELTGQLRVVVLALVASMVGGTVVVARAMFLSTHDLAVTLWVAGVSGLVALLGGHPAGAQLHARGPPAARVGPGRRRRRDRRRRGLADQRARRARPGARRHQRAAGAGPRRGPARRGVAARAGRLGLARPPDARWPASGPWPRRSRTGSSTTRTATTAASAPRSTASPAWWTTCSSCRGSRPASSARSARPPRSTTSISDVVADVAPRAEERGVSVVVRGDLDRTLVVDHRQLARALENLLSNALRFSPGARRSSSASGTGPTSSRSP